MKPRMSAFANAASSHCGRCSGDSLPSQSVGSGTRPQYTPRWGRSHLQTLVGSFQHMTSFVGVSAAILGGCGRLLLPPVALPGFTLSPPVVLEIMVKASTSMLDWPISLPSRVLIVQINSLCGGNSHQTVDTVRESADTVKLWPFLVWVSAVRTKFESSPPDCAVQKAAFGST